MGFMNTAKKTSPKARDTRRHQPLPRQGGTARAFPNDDDDNDGTGDHSDEEGPFAESGIDLGESLVSLLDQPVDELIASLGTVLLCRLDADAVDALRGKLLDGRATKDVNDELVSQIAELAEENGALLARCDRLEREKAKFEECKVASGLGLAARRSISIDSFTDSVDTTEHASLRATVRDLRDENDALHASMEEAMQFAAGMNAKMTQFVERHESSVTEYEAKLASLQRELDEAKMENERQSERMQSLASEREEAYEACGVLQEEINLLRNNASAEVELDECHHDDVESLYSHDDESVSTTQDQQQRLTELAELCASLTIELEQKNAAMEAVHSDLAALQVEQSTVREAAAELRAENDRLRAEGCNETGSEEDTSSEHHGNQPHGERRATRKVRKENRGLRQANKALSTRLLEEMERTEALADANEGLAARICKLVAHIGEQRRMLAAAGSCGDGVGGCGRGGSGVVTAASSFESGSSGRSSSNKGSTGSSRVSRGRGAPPVEQVSIEHASMAVLVGESQFFGR